LTASLAIEAAIIGGRTVASELSGTEPWRPRVIPGSSGGFARVLLVQSRAGLLGGDQVALSVVVGPGARLELGEIGATVVHDARGGEPARATVSVRVHPGGRLVWLAAPMIVAAGAAVERSMEVEVAARGSLALAESFVLGRAAEEPGGLVARTRVVCDGAPLRGETVDTRDRASLRSPVVAGQARMLAGCVLVGARCSELGEPGVMQLFGPGTVWRGLGEAVELARRAARVNASFAEIVRASEPLIPLRSAVSPVSARDARRRR
jgi:urease accessory protein